MSLNLTRKVLVGFFVFTGLFFVVCSPLNAEGGGEIRREFYESGEVFSETNCFEDNDDGFYREYHPNGNLKMSVEYEDGMMHGAYRDYCEDGTLRLKLDYKNNRQDGYYRLYYNDGTLEAEGQYKDGREVGVHRVYYPDGTWAAEANYKDGREQGVARTYYEDGSVWEEFNYQDGVLEGDVREYYPDGVLKIKSVYADGVLIKQENYDHDRKLMMNVMQEKLFQGVERESHHMCSSELLGMEFACRPEWKLKKRHRTLMITISEHPSVELEISESPHELKLLSEFSHEALDAQYRYADNYSVERIELCGRDSIKVLGFLLENPDQPIEDYYLIDHYDIHGIKFTFASQRAQLEYRPVVDEIIESIKFIKHTGEIGFQEDQAESCADILKEE